tara:strand:+ start:1886 stop:3046 length:1161 start_codon:yes stop_codon:yes gene_type:complete
MTSEPVSFVFAGDIMCHKQNLDAALVSPAAGQTLSIYDFNPSFEKVAPIISTADFAIANLETTLPGENLPNGYTGYPHFGSPDSLAGAAKKAGFDILTTANNHSFDYGVSGMRRTISALNELRLRQTGTFTTVEGRNSNPALIIERNNVRIGLLNYTYGLNVVTTDEMTSLVHLIDAKTISNHIDMIRDEVDCVVLYLHWGREYKTRPSADQTKLASQLISYGADAIIGSHPHVIQSFEIRKNRKDRYGRVNDRIVAYSLGNFFGGQRNRRSDGGMVLQFSVGIRQASESNPARLLPEPINSNPSPELRANGTDRGNKLFFEKVRHELVWIATPDSLREESVTYQLLPVKEWRNRTGELTEAARSEMQQFERDSAGIISGKGGSRN